MMGTEVEARPAIAPVVSASAQRVEKEPLSWPAGLER